MLKNAVLGARLIRVAATGAVAVSLPLATAACSSSTSTASTTASTISATALLGGGCKAIPASTISQLRNGKGLADALKNPMFSQFSKEIKKAQLGALLESVTKLTIIMPTNAAFTQMSKAMAKALKKRGNLAMTLRGHALGMRITPVMFVKGTRMPTLAGNLASFTRAGTTYKVNGVPVDCGNIQVGGTTLYIVGSVLAPPK